MWDDQKAERYFTLRHGGAHLTEAERTELVGLQRERDEAFAVTLNIQQHTSRKHRSRKATGDSSLPRQLSMAGVTSVFFGGIAAIGAIFLFLGGSINSGGGHPAEVAWGRAVSHFTCFGPCVAISWGALYCATDKGRYVAWASLFTTIWVLGCCTLR